MSLWNNNFPDVLAVVKSVSDVVGLKAKTTGRDLKKRDIHLVDNSNTMVKISMIHLKGSKFRK